MKSSLAQVVRSWSLVTVFLCAWQPSLPADTVPVRHVQGTLHGLLDPRSQDGLVIASGDLVQVVNGGQVTAHLVFTFKDGSIDDETTVFSQRRAFHLIAYHHIQKGPFFPHPIDMSIDARSHQVTIRSQGKDGKEDVKTDHIDLPPDLANGLVSAVIENLQPNAPETKVSMLVATPKPLLIKLDIAPRGEESFSLVGASRKAIHYRVKIELGGVAGKVAPIIGKQPPDIQVWTTGGQAPTFIREQGPLYPDGPILTMELASPTWPDSQHSGN
jgi:hypothetical protein